MFCIYAAALLSYVIYKENVLHIYISWNFTYSEDFVYAKLNETMAGCCLRLSDVMVL